MKKIKVLSLVLCIIMLVSMALAGCSKTDSGTTDSKASGDSAKSSSESKSGGQITLSFWKAPHSDREAEYWEPILSKFMDENPNIKVEMLVTPWDTWTEKYTAAFAGGTPPDVSYMTEWYPNFADAGQLADLTPYITDEIKARYSRGSWDYATYNGKIIGIPFILVNSIIYYNKDIFEKEGINIPNTWDELIDAARKATKDLDGDGKTDQWGFAFKFMPEVDIHQIMPTVIQAGCTYLSEDQKELGFANENGIKALQFIADMVLKEKVAPPIDMFDKDQLKDAVFTGKIAMINEQIPFYNEIMNANPDLKIGAFVAPAGPADDEICARASMAAIGLFSMAEASKNKDAAWKLIEFLTTPEIESIYLKQANFLSPNEESNAIMYPDHEIMAVASDALKHGFGYPVHNKWKEIDTIIKDMLEEIFREAKTVEKAVMDANEKAKEVLK